MEIINSKIISISKEHEDIENDYEREHRINHDLCEYITELEIKIERLEKESKELEEAKELIAKLYNTIFK